MFIMNSQNGVVCYSQDTQLKGKAVEVFYQKGGDIKREDLWKVVLPMLLIGAIFVYPFFFPPKGGE